MNYTLVYVSFYVPNYILTTSDVSCFIYVICYIRICLYNSYLNMDIIKMISITNDQSIQVKHEAFGYKITLSHNKFHFKNN